MNFAQKNKRTKVSPALSNMQVASEVMSLSDKSLVTVYNRRSRQQKNVRIKTTTTANKENERPKYVISNVRP
jgi:hypothetical protein